MKKDELLKKKKIKSRIKSTTVSKKRFDSEPVYNRKHLILIDFVFEIGKNYFPKVILEERIKIGKNYYPHVTLEERKYIAKEKKSD